MPNYEKFTSEAGLDFIRRFNDDETISEIPADESNSDYQAYLASLDEQQAAIAEQAKLTK